MFGTKQLAQALCLMGLVLCFTLGATNSIANSYSDEDQSSSEWMDYSSQHSTHVNSGYSYEKWVGHGFQRHRKRVYHHWHHYCPHPGPRNYSPTANNQWERTELNQSVSITLDATDPDGDLLDYQIWKQPRHGVLSGDAPNLIYTPNTDFIGWDRFTYKVSDGELHAMATVKIRVKPSPNKPPKAHRQTVMTEAGVPLDITLTATDQDGDTLTWEVRSQPANGTLSGTAPNLIYTPDPGFVGWDRFRFRVNDGRVNSNTAKVKIKVKPNTNPVNQAPVAGNQQLIIDEDQPLTLLLTATDADDDDLDFTVVSAPQNGQLSGEAPNLVYTPNPGFNGNDSLTFIANDGELDSNIASIAITVNAVNDVPTAENQSLNTAEDTPLSITLIATDPDGDTLDYLLDTEPQNGVLSGTAPNLVYTPNSNFTGSDSFTFSASDDSASSNTATVLIAIEPVNDAPQAQAADVSVDEDGSINITLEGSDVEDDLLSFTIIDSPVNGSLSGEAPNLVYTPNADFNGSDTLTFIVNDGEFDSAVASVDITVNAVNDAPAVQNAELTLDEDGSAAVTVVGSDIDGDALVFSITEQPANGVLSGTAPDFTYTPNANFNGTDSFKFIANDGVDSSGEASVSITINAINDAPQADSATVAVNEDNSATIVLTGTDVDGDTLSYTVTAQPQNGVLSGVAPNLLYTPNADFNGTDSFGFSVSDGSVVSAEASISITVVSINDAPVAQQLAVTLDEDNAVNIELTANDADGDVVSFRIVTQPVNGVLSGDAPNLIYTPNADFNGADSFSFVANDGTVDSEAVTASLTVSPVNDVPVAQTATAVVDEDGFTDISLSASDIDGDTLSFTITEQPGNGVLSGVAPNLTYTPNADFNGADSFGFLVSDGSVDSPVATITITVNSINDAPIGSAAAVSMDEDGTIAITLAANDADGDALTFAIATQPANGQLAGTPPAMTYTPDVDFNGSDGFSFVASDGTVESTPASVAITVNSVNDAPQASSFAIELDQDSSAVAVLNASDVDGDALAYELIDTPQNGVLSGDFSSTPPELIYTPNTGFVGDDQFSYRVSDGLAQSAIATVSISVLAVNQPPAITSQPPAQIDEGAQYQYQLIANDPENDALSFALEQGPQGMTLSSDGLLEWTADPALANGSELDNPYCRVPAGISPATPASIDAAMVLDNSGSNAAAWIWVADAMQELDGRLKLVDIGTSEPSRYALTGFNPPQEQLLIGGETFGSISDFYETSYGGVRPAGASEAALQGLIRTVTDFPFRADASKNIIWVPDEPEQSSGFYRNQLPEFTQRLIDENYRVNIITRLSLRCLDNDQLVLGMDADGRGYADDGSDGFRYCDVDATQLYNDTSSYVNGYVEPMIQPALTAGGAVWSLSAMRDEQRAQALLKAVTTRMYETILQFDDENRQADIAMTGVTLQADNSVSVTLMNRGLAAMPQAALVEVYEASSSTLLGTATVNPLAAQQSENVVVALASAVFDSLEIVVSNPDSGECLIDNNRLTPALVEVSVDDGNGGVDQQRFTIVVDDVNQTPLITSTPPTVAAVGQRYRYEAAFSDPDIGDDHIFTITGPGNALIDAETGVLEITPTAEQLGDLPLTVTVTDIAGAADSQPFAITVSGDYLLPRFGELPGEIRQLVDEPFTITPTVTADPSAVLSFELLTSPAGMTIDTATGRVDWVPAQTEFERLRLVTLGVSDQFGNRDLVSFVLLLDIPNQAPVVTSEPLASVVQGQDYRYDAEFADVNFREEFDLALQTSAPGMTIEGSVRFSLDEPLAELLWRDADTVHPSRLPAVDHLCVAAGSDTQIASASVQLTEFSRLSVNETNILPLVVPVTDTNGDGQIDRNDRSAIIAFDLQSSVKSLKAWDPVEDEVLWQYDYNISSSPRPVPRIAPAAGDINADGVIDIVYENGAARLVAVSTDDGRELWVSSDRVDNANRSQITLTDLEGDGQVEILAGYQVFNAFGQEIFGFEALSAGVTAFAGPIYPIDVDLDGQKELVHNGRIYAADGSLIRQPAFADGHSSELGYSAFANVDADPLPEMILAERDRATNVANIHLLDDDGSVIWSYGPVSYIGRPVIGDLAGDGQLAVFVPGENVALSMAGDELWRITEDLNNRDAAAASAADLQGDGRLEILLHDPVLSVYDGQTGAQILRGETGTNMGYTQSRPIVVDLNADGKAEVISGFSGSNEAIVVLDYAGDSLNPAIPRLQSQHWQSLDTLTQTLAVNPTAHANWEFDNTDQVAVPVTQTFSAGVADLRVSAPQGDHRQNVTVSVSNRGTADFAGSFELSLYAGDPAGSGELLASQSFTNLPMRQVITATFTPTLPDGFSGELFAQVSPVAPVNECRYENNISSAHIVDWTVTDHAGETGTQSYLLEVSAPTTAATQEYDSAGLGSITEGEAFALDIDLDFTDSDTTNSAFFYLQSAPRGMAIDAQTGVVQWTPAFGQAGEHTFRVVNQHLTGVIRRNYRLTVLPAPNSAPDILSTPPATARVGEDYVYAVEADDRDGDTLQFRLLDSPEGMSINADTGLINWLPLSDQLGQQTVSVQADDLRGGTITQTFTLTVLTGAANNPPQISSTPLGSAVIGQVYSYVVQATDPDGDALSYQLLNAPTGVTLDASGNLLWTPQVDQTGLREIAVRVVDDRGGYAVQSWSVAVSDGSGGTGLLPSIDSEPPVNARQGYDYRYQMVVNDPTGSGLTYELTEAPTGMTISATGLVQWTPGSERLVPVTVRVTNAVGWIEQRWLIQVLEPGERLQGRITATPAMIGEGETVDIAVAVFNAVGTVGVSLTLDGQPLTVDASNQAQWTATGIGPHTLEATITDDTGSTVETLTIYVQDPADMDAPQLELHAPVSGTQVTAPVPVIATISDDNPVSWQLLLVEKGQADSGRIASELQVLEEGSGNVANAEIAVFDPSLHRNGQYALILVATDSNGLESQTSTTIDVEGDLKAGNFSITFEDLNIPLAGIPISVRRTYDSRDKAKALDFGYGWSIDYQNVKVEESRDPGVGWTLNEYKTGPMQALTNFCVEPLGAPIITVTLPDGAVERFETQASPRCGLLQAILDVELVFNPLDDTQSTLEALDDNTGRLVGGNLVEQSSFTRTIDPTRYRLTTRAGYEYELDQRFGVRRVIDPNGNTLDYSDDGIVHSSGKRVDFIRDALGRITAVTDPNGGQLSYQYDANSDLLSVTDRDSAQTTFTYNQRHGLLDIIDPLGRNIVKNIYDDDGRLIAQEDSNGDRTEFNHDVSGRQSVVTDRNNHVSFYFYDDRGNVTSMVDALGNTTTFTFDERDNQLSQTDALGNQSIASYSERNDQLTQVDELGNTTSFVYNQRGQETEITDARGNRFENTYDSVGNLLSVRDPLDNLAGNNINALGLPSRTVDALGHVTEFTYDDEGNKLTETDAEGNITRFSYDANNNVLSEVRTRLIGGVATEETTTYGYDDRDRVITTIDPLGNITRSEYDLAGRETAQIDALGRRTEMDYDPYGRLLETRYPDGTTENKTYDPEGNLLTETDRLGRTTSYQYDALNRLTQTTYADGSTNQTEYDPVGRVAAEIDANGNRSEYSYDAAGRRTGVTDALGNVTSYTFDGDGNRTSMTDARGNTTSYMFNELDQKTQTTFANGSTMGETYDALERKTGQTDQAGLAMSYEYDKLGRLTKVIDALGQETTYTYDSVGNKLTQTDALGRTTTWGYDALGRVISRTLPEGQVETMQYDGVGNLISQVDFDGDIVTHSYDINNRLTQSVYADVSETFAYDAVGNRVEATKTENATTSIWRYTYDNRNRLVSETQFADTTDEVVLSYQYDAQGNRTQLTRTPVAGTATTITYAFDTLNRLASVTDADNNTTTYGYDAVGNRASIQHANGNRVSYTYDALNRLTDITHRNSANVILKRFAYTLNPSGKRTRISEDSGRITDYTYDNLYRLTGETITDLSNGNYSANYQYDAVGNRVYETVAGVSTAYTYDNNDRLIQTGGTVFTYDNNGNTLTETLDSNTITYSYNARNELTARQEGSEATVYLYNPDGIRIGQADSTNQTLYTVDSNRDYQQVIAEIVDDNEAVNYVYGDDLISQKRGTDTSVYLYDGLGSTRALSDATGSITDTYDYAAFGELLNQTGTTENDYLYTGEQFDAGMDQYYLRARYYNQDLGRFHSMDTWMGVNSDPQTLHKYLYTHADPVNNIDPTGNFTLGSLSRAQSIQAELGLAQADFGFSLFDSVLTGDTPSAQARLLGLAVLGGPAAFKLLRKFSSRFRKVCGRSNSFEASTLVSTEFGSKPIEDIKIGDQVWAFNEDTGERSLQEVVHLILGEGEKNLVDITLASGEVIKTTNEHPFFVGQEWINAVDLTKGVQLLDLNGSLVSVDSVNHYAKNSKVYNLTVDKDHTYYVGKSKVLSHNAGICPKNINIRSRPQFGHTFSTHGEGAKNTKRLIGRANSKGTPQGQWMNNKEASEFLAVLSHGIDKPTPVRIPLGLGQVIEKGGKITPAQWALVVPSPTGLRTAYPILDSHPSLTQLVR